MKNILAAAVLLGAVILAWQAGGVIKAFVAAWAARVSAERVTSESPHPAAVPAEFTMNLPGGGTFTCRLGPRTVYSCTPPPVRNSVRGVR